MPTPLSVLSVTAELDGLMKTGGLGEVAAALPAAFEGRVQMRVLMPGLPAVWAKFQRHRRWGTVPARGLLPTAQVWEGISPQGFPLYVLDSPALYDRPGTPYGPAPGTDHPDNFVRFAALGWAAAHMSQGGPREGWRPEVLHLHDWSAALGAAYAAHLPRPVPTVLTLHNLVYQGLFEPPWPDVGLDARDEADALFWGKFPVCCWESSEPPVSPRSVLLMRNRSYRPPGAVAWMACWPNGPSAGSSRASSMASRHWLPCPPISAKNNAAPCRTILA